MGPLAFVNWRSVNTHFCVLMWVVALVLAVVVLVQATSPAPDLHHNVRPPALIR